MQIPNKNYILTLALWPYTLPEECESVFPVRADGFLNFSEYKVTEGFVQFFLYNEQCVMDGLFPYERFIDAVRQYGVRQFDAEHIRKIEFEDISSILPVYIAYYNNQEDSCWTETTAGKRIHQVLSMEDSYGLLMEENGTIVGFAMGYFKQYDDIMGYTLEEIVIATEYQNKGYGSALLEELEMKVRVIKVCIFYSTFW